MSNHRDYNGASQYQGSVYVFDYQGNQIGTKLTADSDDVGRDPDLQWGSSLALSNNYIAVAS